MPELNPVTRTRLWYIVIFLAMDGIAAYYASSIIPPTNTLALVAWAVAALSVVGAVSLASFLIATRKMTTELKSQRSRE